MNVKFNEITSNALSVSRSRRNALALTGAGFAAAALATAMPSFFAGRSADARQDGNDFSGRVDIGDGRHMFIQSRGEGDPTVVFLAGYGNTGGAFIVQPDDVPPPSVYAGVAAFTWVCTYDRPGTVLESEPPDNQSQSDAISQPTTVELAIDDLHALLEAAEIPGPYVMVGHSFGGLLSRLYASTYPDEVVGMVLVDPFTEAIRSALGTEHWETWRSTNGVVSEEYLAAHPETERFDINAAADSMERVLASQPLRDMPIFALTAGLTGEMSAEQIAALPPGYPDALSGALAASAEFLTNLLPAAKHLYVADSGHYIQAEKPNLVIDAVRQVVQAVREPATWSA